MKQITGKDSKELKTILSDLKIEYEKSDRPFFVQEVAKGYSIATKPDYAKWIKKMFNDEKRIMLSKASIETLAIIAYNQPLTRIEIEKIRGVGCSSILLNLLKNNFIKVIGRKKVPGNPLLYKVTEKFLLHFGLKSMSDLPPVDQLGLEYEENQITEIFSKTGN